MADDATQESSTSTSEELARRLKNHRLQRLLPSWAEQLSAALGTAVSEAQILPVDETEQFRSRFYSKARATEVQRFYWIGDSAEPGHATGLTGQQHAEVLETLRVIQQRFSAEVVLLFHAEGYDGAVTVPSDLVLTKATHILGSIPNDLAFATRDLNDGLLLEFSHLGHHPDGRSRDEYELVAWGKFSALPAEVIAAALSSQMGR